MRATWPRSTRRFARRPHKAWHSLARWLRRPTSVPRWTSRSTTCSRRRLRPPTRSRCRRPGAPFGSLRVDTAKCTMCLSCVGACPEAALADNPDKPQLRFIEKNCVQCGLCATTCPEGAITLQPRLWLADGGKARKAPRVLNEAEPYRCIQCGKPFGTLRAIENMLTKLSGHSAFQGDALKRLQMCGDCRVIDIYSNPNETKITDL